MNRSNGLMEKSLEDVRQVILSGNCVAFIGSGLSCPPYPSWRKLVADLCNACGVSVPFDEDLNDARKLLALADDCKTKNKTSYYSKLYEIFGTPPVETRFIYRMLAKLSFCSYITSNYDPLLKSEKDHEQRNFGNIYALHSLPSHKLEDRSIYYIHGLIDQSNRPQDGSVILSASDFLQAYDGAENGLKRLLHEAYTYKSLCFFGCSIGEPQLRYVFEQALRTRKEIESQYTGARAPDHFAIRPYAYRKDTECHEAYERDYAAEQRENETFLELGIRVARYEPVNDKHSGLDREIAKWLEITPQPIRSGFEPRELT